MTQKVSSDKSVSTQLSSKVQPIIMPPRTPYSEVVENPASIVSNKSTLKSTSDMLRHLSTSMSYKGPTSTITSVPEQNRTKLPFKLIPVEPPQKKSDVKTTAISAASTILNKLPEKKVPKVKLKSKKGVVIQRRALSPVSEDMEPSEVREQQKNNVGVEGTDNNKILSFEESMEFETIDEQDLPILTEESTTTFSQEGANQFVVKTVPNINSQDMNSPVGSTSSSNEQTTFVENEITPVSTSSELAKNTEALDELSTPDRPSGPLLEEQFETPIVSESTTNTEIQQSSESVRAQLTSSKEVAVIEANPNTGLSTPDRPSGPLLEETIQMYYLLSMRWNIHL